MTFDPYAEWFGISAGPRPPNHYELIGVPFGEADPQRIHEAALDRILSLRKHQAGKHSELSQRLMNEVSQARLCLLDRDRKAAYDNALASAAAAVAGERGAAAASDTTPRRVEPRRFGTLRAVAAFATVLLLLWGVRQYLDHSSARGLFDNPTEPVQGTAANDVSEIGDVPSGTPMPPSDRQAPPAVRRPAGQPGVFAKWLRQLGWPPRTRFDLKKLQAWKDSVHWLPPNWIVLDSIGQPIPRLQTEPMLPVNLWFVNSAEHETEPWLGSDGLLLHFTRATRTRDRLLFAWRGTTGDHFTLVGRLAGLPDRGDQQSLVLWANDTTAVFASNHRRDDGLFELFEADRPGAHWPFAAPRTIATLAAEDADCLHPCVSSDGRTLYFSRFENDTFRQYVATRPDKNGAFGTAKRLSFPENFHHASVTADGKTMVLQGPISRTHWGIYRSRRKSAAEEWGPPTLLADVVDPVGPLGDVAPSVTADGRQLFFASDRPGGAGGLDLWVAELRAAERPREGAGGVRSAVIDDWLILGPMPQNWEGTTAEQLGRLPPPQLRRVPPKEGAEDKKSGLVWRRGVALDGGPGIYFVAFPFEVKRSSRAVVVIGNFPGLAVFWLDGEPVVSSTDVRPKKEKKKEDHKGEARSNPAALRRGKHRLFGAVLVADVTVPPVIRLVDAETDEALSDREADFRSP